MRRTTTIALGIFLAAAIARVSTPASGAPLAFTLNRTGTLPGGVAGAVIFSIANARLTRPGIDDIVVGGGTFPPAPESKVPLRLMAPQGDGTVLEVTGAAFGPTPPALTGPREILFDDFNGDGRLDIFAAGTGYDAAPFLGETNALALSLPGGSFSNASGLLPAATDYSHSAAVGDINNDGKEDVCVINLGPPVASYCLLGNGGTAFTNGGQLPATLTSFATRYTASILLDVDKDGYPDLILGREATFSWEQSVILYNDGTGDFTKRPSVTLPPGLFADNTINLSYAAIDINGDGWPDLLVSQTQNSPFYVGRGIQVLVNDQHGGFVDQTATYIPDSVSLTGTWIQFIRVIDLNGDGLPDFFAQGRLGAWDGKPVVFAWVNDGTGHYQGVDSSWIVGSSPSPGSAYSFVAFVDQDGDGLPDLVNLWVDALGAIHYQTFRNVTPSGPVRLLIPDGTSLKQTFTTYPETRLFAIPVEPGKTYVIDVADANGDLPNNAIGTLNVFAVDGITAPPEASVDCTTANAPRPPAVAVANDGIRCVLRTQPPFNGSAQNKRPVYVKVTRMDPASGGGSQFRIRAREATVYGRWITAGVDYHVELENTTADAMCVELTRYPASGLAYALPAGWSGAVKSVTLTVPAFGAAKKVFTNGDQVGTDAEGALRMGACASSTNLIAAGLHASTYAFDPVLSRFIYFFTTTANEGKTRSTW